MMDEDSCSTDLSVSGKEGYPTISLAHYSFLVLIEGKVLLATLARPQNCTKMLRNPTFVVQFEYFSIRL